MAHITLNTPKLKYNFDYLNELFEANGIEWSVVAKLLCGNEKFLQALLQFCHKDICDSRLSNLKTIKKLSPDQQTVYIKPPAKHLAKDIVKYADVSFNSEVATIRALSEEACTQNKVHRIVIMVEMGELREGIMARDLSRFYGKIRKLPNIRIVGIGTNLNCLNGILPDEKKLRKLNRYKTIVEKTYDVQLPYISAGSSVTIPLIYQNQIPGGINHFRVGESLFFGTDVFHDDVIPPMYQDVFTLTAEIIEIHEKPMVPAGNSGTNLTGNKIRFDDTDRSRTSFRAIVDVGILDIEAQHIQPMNKAMKILGASSDMMILDVADNPEKLRVGDKLDFSPNYLSVLRAMNSNYIDKHVERKIRLNEFKILQCKN